MNQFINQFRKLSFILIVVLLPALAFAEQVPSNDQVVENIEPISCPAFLQHKMRKLNSKQHLDICKEFQGKTFLLVNTASNCGFTPQFKALEALYQQYKEQGLVVLGFPSDNFFQEEDEEKNTAKVCFINYGVTFPMLATIEVRGDDAHPIFAHLGEHTAAPYWNFYKYLVSSDGKSIQRFSSKVEPQASELITAIEAQL